MSDVPPSLLKATAGKQMSDVWCLRSEVGASVFAKASPDKSHECFDPTSRCRVSGFRNQRAESCL